MKPIARFTLAGGAGLAAAAFFALPAHASSPDHNHFARGAVFVQSDNTAGNTVTAYRRGTDGTLTEASTYATGGLGGALDGSVVDHLASQGSLTYDHASHLLYAVNAGSDTVTVFDVRGDQLHRVQVVASGGTFPVSIASHGHLVYVLNARNGGSVQGYVRLGEHLFRVPSWNRSLGLDPSLTPEFTSTPGQVAFTPDGSKLIVTTKNNHNQIDVFRLGLFGTPSASPVVTPDPGNVPFAVTFDRSGRLQVSEAGPNAVATYVVNRDGTLTFTGRAATGQSATCWITTTGTEVYAGNAGSGTISRFRADQTGLVSQGTTATDAGTVDLAISPDRRNLYAQTGAAGIVDEFVVSSNGALTKIGSVLVPDAVGGQGIATT